MRPLTIVSPMNMFALASYSCLSVLGLAYSTREPPEALGVLIGQELANLWSIGLLVSGLAAISAIFMAGKMNNPSVALSVEIVTLLPISFLSAVYTYSLIDGYGFNSIPATTIFALFTTIGCISRVVQAGWDRYKLSRAHRVAPATIEVAAEPDG